MLTRDQILASSDLRVVAVDVPEWGGSVNVRTMTGAERSRLEALYIDGKAGGANIRALVACLCLCDAAGARMFKDGDEDALAGKSAAALDRVFDAAAKLNKLGGAGAEDARRDFGEGPN